jgi:transposase InsO family protein
MLVELKVVEQRYLAVLEVISGVAVTDVAKRYGVSRQSVHAWVRRYKADGMGGLADRSHRPKGHPKQVSPEIEAAVCEMRRAHRKWGPKRIEYELAQRGVTATRSTVYRILVRHGLISPVARKRRRSDYVRWERDAPMQLWQMDVTASAFLKSGTELKIVTAIDDHSRFCIAAKVVRRGSSRAVCGTFVEAMALFGVPEEVLTDNGSVFTGWFLKPRPPTEVLFDRICRENGITHRLTKVRSPTTTGKIERLHQTLQLEVLEPEGPFDDIDHAQRAIDAWRNEYNTVRPHQSLDMAIPATRFSPAPDTSPALVVPPELRVIRGKVPDGHIVAQVELEPEPEFDWDPCAGFEVDRVVPESGNLSVGSQQIWLGAHVGKLITLWMDLSYVHVLFDGHRLKTLPCRLSEAELRRLGKGARPSPQAPSSGTDGAAVIEIDRTVNAGGTVSLHYAQVSVGVMLSGRRVTLRLEGEVMLVISDGEILRTLACPVPQEKRLGLRGARLAEGLVARTPSAITVERRVSSRGVIFVATQRIHIGLVHAHKVLRVVADSNAFTVFDGDDELRTVKRTTSSDIVAWKARREEVAPRASSR